MMSKKESKPNSGRGKSMLFPKGRRRIVGGEELAPRSFRKKGKYYLSECSEEELEEAGLI